MSGSSAKTDFFVVGAPKCGTTSLYRYLQQHPQVFLPEVKEIHHFCTDFHEARKENGNYRRFSYCEEAEYRSLYEDRRNGEMAGDVAVLHLRSLTAAGCIYDYNPDAKIIVVIREPVDFLLSVHAENVKNHVETIPSFWNAWLAEGERKKNKKHNFLYYSERVKFDEQIQRYIALFGSDQVKVCLFDDLQDDSASFLLDIYGFLGISASFLPDLRVHNARKKKDISDRWRVFLKYMHIYIGKYLPPFLREKLKIVSFKSLLSAADTEVLKKRYLPLILSLEKYFKRDLRRFWGY